MTNDYCWITIGPKGFHKENLEKLAGYDPKGIRINTGRNNYEWINSAIRTLIQAGYDASKIYLDIGNHKPRVSLFDIRMDIKKGTSFLFGGPFSSNSLSGKIDNEIFFSMLKKDDILILNDGEIECVVIDKDEKQVELCPKLDGYITNNASIGLKGKHYENYYIAPNEVLLINSLLEKYPLGLIISFVEKKENIIECRKTFPNAYRIIPKIESNIAYNNIDGILQYSDWALLGRGDFALSVGIEKIGYYQKKILSMARKYNCKLIIASGTLESLEKNKLPFRSEIIDITNSYYEGAAGIMLTNESGASECPFKVIDFLYSVIDYLESRK